MTKPLTEQLISDPKLFGYRLKQIRAMLKLSQAELAEKIGKTPAAYASWETGRRLPRLASLKGIADALGVPVAVLTGDQELDMTKEFSEQYFEVGEKIPLISPSSFAGGKEWTEIFKYAKEMPVSLCPPSERKKWFAVNVDSTSMEAQNSVRTIPCGAKLICTSEIIPEEIRGSVCVVSVDGASAVIREVDYDRRDLILIPWNAAFKTQRVPQTRARLYGRARCALMAL